MMIVHPNNHIHIHGHGCGHSCGCGTCCHCNCWCHHQWHWHPVTPYYPPPRPVEPWWNTTSAPRITCEAQQTINALSGREASSTHA